MVGHFLTSKQNVTFSRAFSVVEWTCFRSKNCVPSTQYPVPSTQYPVPSTQYPVPSTQYPVPSTQYPVPSTQYPVPSTQYPVPSTQYPVPSTQYPVPSTQYPVPSTQYPVPSTKGPMEGSEMAIACDTMSWEGGILACAAGARYATFIVSAYPFFSLFVGFYELRPSNGGV